MEIILLLKSALGLIIVLGILIFLFFYSSKKKKAKIQARVEKTVQKIEINSQKIDLDSLRLKLRKRKTTAKELMDVIDLILKHYGVIHKKMGMRPHPDFDAYTDIFMSICRHPNTNKNIILKFDKELSRLNPEYKSDINEAMTKGLNSRGV